MTERSDSATFGTFVFTRQDLFLIQRIFKTQFIQFILSTLCLRQGSKCIKMILSLRNNHTIVLLALIVTAYFLLLGERGRSFADEKPLIGIADFFPEIPLPVPKDPGERTYLGLTNRETFALSEIMADLVLVEILNVHCPNCRKQAAPYNELYALIEQDRKTRGKIKIIGIGAGNDEKEIESFKREYRIPFPIIPDPQFVLHRAIGRSRTPYAIYVRLDPKGGPGVVAGTHLGTHDDYNDLFQVLNAYMKVSIAAIRGPENKEKAQTSLIAPFLPEEDLQRIVKAAFRLFGEPVDFHRIYLKDSRKIYTSRVEGEGASKRLFAESVSRPSVCDVCHDVHFIYVFHYSGEILTLVPLQLTKWGNEAWNESDIGKMKNRIVGRSLEEDIDFNPEVDAVSSATMTSAIIFDSLSQGKALLEELKQQGWR